MTDNKSIRIGRIDFTNVWPIFYHFPKERFEEEAEFVLQVPTSLNRAMAAGQIDMGPISSFSYGEHHKDYMLFPDMSVSAFGRVNSILLFHRRPLPEVAAGKVMLPTTSATSVNLLKIILEKFYGGRPEYAFAAPSLDDMMQQADAALLIGDDAIRANRNNPGFEVTDLGLIWHELTGHWMTFAVWAVRRDAISRTPDLVRRLYHAFLAGKERGLADPEEMVTEAVSRIGGTRDYWYGYFTRLCYDFGPDQWAGLDLYYRYAYELGLLNEPAELHIWQEPTTNPLQR